MPGKPNAEQAENEFAEFRVRGPFGGIQSELPPDAYESFGFSDALNLVLRKSVIVVAPGYQDLRSVPNTETNPVLGAYDFFDSIGIRHQVVFYQDQIFTYAGGVWTRVTTASGPTGGATNFFAVEDLNYLMCYTQGIDTIQCWDGNPAHATTAPVGAPSGLYLMELASHLICGYITSGGTFPSMYKYSAAGDPTNWTNFDTGTYNLANLLGPIRGLGKVNGVGYSLHHFGLNQIYPTGNAAFPFYNFGVASKGKGCPYPFGAAYLGNQAFFWPGANDVYMFDGSNIVPIGSRKLQGGAEVGARSRIMAELALANVSAVYGAVSETINGNDFNAYWLVIPNGSTWIYNIDEGSWTRRVWDRTPSIVSRFYNPLSVTWLDLIGSWQAQTWAWNGLPVGQSDDWFVGMKDGTAGLIDFTQPCESNFSIVSGENVCQDRRHNKFMKALRLVFQDTGPFAITVVFSNELNQTDTHTVSWAGSGTGKTFQAQIPTKIQGISLSYTINGVGSVDITIVELAPIFDMASEMKSLYGGLLAIS